MLQQDTIGMESKDESRIAVAGYLIAGPTRKDDVTGERPKKIITVVFMAGCVLWSRQGWVSTDVKTSISVSSPIGGGTLRDQ
jgi:hypothetical protein